MKRRVKEINRYRYKDENIQRYKGIKIYLFSKLVWTSYCKLVIDIKKILFHAPIFGTLGDNQNKNKNKRYTDKEIEIYKDKEIEISRDKRIQRYKAKDIKELIYKYIRDKEIKE